MKDIKSNLYLAFTEVFKNFHLTSINLLVISVKAVIIAFCWLKVCEFANYPREMAYSVCFYILLCLLNPISELKSKYQQYVASGDILLTYTQPGTLYAKFVSYLLGRWLGFSLLLLVPAILIIQTLFTLPEFTATKVIITFSLLMVGVIVLVLERVFIEGLTFWVHDVFSLNHMHSALRVFLSGAFFPSEILPDSMKTFMTYNPYALSISAPIRYLVYPGYSINLSLMICINIAYIIILLGILHLQNLMIQRRLVVYGG